MTRIYRMRDVCESSGLSRSSIYRLIAAGEFPKPIRIGIHAVGWVSDDLDTWLSSRREGAQ